jgi:hypothetical protein
MAAALESFVQPLVIAPRIEPRVPGSYEPPGPGDTRPQENFQLGIITRFVTTIVKAGEQTSPPNTWPGCRANDR